VESDILRIKKEDSIFPKGKRSYLVFPDTNLVPGTITEDEDFFEIALDISGLNPAQILTKGEGPDRYRFAIACAGLENLRETYSFSLNPENLMFDASFTPKVRLRDGAHREDEGGFLREYKALIASLLVPAYSFADYYEGGEGLFGKNELLKEIAPLQDTASVVSVLENALSELVRKLSKDSVLVDKGRYRSMRIVMIVFICLFAALAAYAGKYYLVDLPQKDTAIAMSDKYLARDYIGVLSEVNEADLALLSKEGRYMAAYAGAATANLNDKQRSAVMQAISLNTDSLYLDYWISMGIGNYEGALDISRRIGDDELELYGLVIYRDAMSINMNITGAEKTEILKTLDDQIKALDEKIGNAAEAGDGNA
jgi:type VII secretion protein EssB